MNTEEIKQQIIYYAVEMSNADNQYDKELYKSFLDYYVDMALKNSRNDGERIKKIA